jgi:hypothetical protein
MLYDLIGQQLPRGLQDVEIVALPQLPLDDKVTVLFRRRGRSVDLEVDPDLGLTEIQIAYLCVAL